ncbi:hypothetical protein WN943_002712 [Citrus x changshan-huyou]
MDSVTDNSWYGFQAAMKTQIPLHCQRIESQSRRFRMESLAVIHRLPEGFCWARTMQRQTIRLRRKYSKAVLRQDVGFFDTDYGAASFTSQVVSTTSNVSR